jgi:hypothetical protein
MVSTKFTTKGNYLACCFGATCAVGRAFHEHFHDLRKVTWGSRYTWRHVLGELDSSIEKFKDIPVVDDCASYTARVRDSLQSLQNNFLSGSPRLQSAVRAMANSMVDWRDDTALEEHLEQLNQSGYDLAVKCVSEWGGPLAQSRISSMKPVALEIKRNPAGLVTYTYCDSRQGPVVLAYGAPKGALLSYLNLDFYFLHEYLSHIFPSWDDDPIKTFSEGYLFMLALWGSDAFAPSSSTIQMRDQDLAQHRETLDRERRALNQRELARLDAQFYEARHPKQFYRLLLELAAYIDPKVPDFGLQFVNYLSMLSQCGDEATLEPVLAAIRDCPEDLANVFHILGQSVENLVSLD